MLLFHSILLRNYNLKWVIIKRISLLINHITFQIEPSLKNWLFQEPRDKFVAAIKLSLLAFEINMF